MRSPVFPVDRAFADEFYRALDRLRAEEQAKHQARADGQSAIDRRLRKLADAIAERVSAHTQNELSRLEARLQELEALLSKPAEARPLIFRTSRRFIARGR